MERMKFWGKIVEVPENRLERVNIFFLTFKRVCGLPDESERLKVWEMGLYYAFCGRKVETRLSYEAEEALENLYQLFSVSRTRSGIKQGKKKIKSELNENQTQIKQESKSEFEGSESAFLQENEPRTNLDDLPDSF